MFVITEHPTRGKLTVPIYVWLTGISDVEEGCLHQAYNLSNLPFVLDRIVLMPDTHQGFGMPIGGVLASKAMIIPNAVGVDIGCGVAFRRTSLKTGAISRETLGNWLDQIMQLIPQGFAHHKKQQRCSALDKFVKEHGEEKRHTTLWTEISRGYNQIGTLGGGNHFIEFQEDQDGSLCLMVHSGSRNFGYQVARYFNDLAKRGRKKWNSSVPKEAALDFLPEETQEAVSYINWMKLACDFARENRSRMMDVICGVIGETQPDLEIRENIDVHHNDVNRENHQGQWVWVHRKGAVRAAEGEVCVIPGAMGRSSYVVRGLGNKLSFESCSHGAGRAMSRKEAIRRFSPPAVIRELSEQGILLGKARLKDVGEEAPAAYKDIEFVMEQQKDLIQVVNRLTAKAVMKG